MSETRSVVTIVVPTCDRPRKLQDCVDALRAAAARAATSVEAIVVVDNNHRSEAVHLSTLSDGDVLIRVLREPETGASRARNRGLAAATTDLVVFVDDDIVVGDDWLDPLVAPLTDPGVGATVGRITLDCTPARPRWLTPNLESWFSALDRGTATRPLDPQEHGWTANLAVRRAAAEGVGGFDDSIGAGMPAAFGEDADFLDDLRDAGDTVIYADRAEVRHQVGPERLRLRWLAGRTYRQGRADVARERRDTASRGRHPLRALRALAGGVRWGVPALARSARDPVRRPGALAEQIAIWSAKAGAAVQWLNRRPGPSSRHE